MPSSEQNHKLWYPFTQQKSAPTPILIESAKAEILYTKDGREIIDGISSWWVNIHGHCHPHIMSEIAKQLNQIDHIMLAGLTHENAELLTSRLLPYLGNPFEHLFYSDNGSTAVEVGLKMAVQYWKNQGVESKNKILAFNHAYHGDTIGAMSVSARSSFTKAFDHLMFDVQFIDPPLINQDNNSILQSFITLVKNKDIAAFIFDESMGFITKRKKL